MSWGQRIRDQPGLEADRTEGADWSLRTNDVHRCALKKKICKPSDLQKSKTIISCRPLIVNILYSLVDCLPPPSLFPPSLCWLSHWKLVEIIKNNTLPQNCSKKTDTFKYFYFISPKKVSMRNKWSCKSVQMPVIHDCTTCPWFEPGWCSESWIFDAEPIWVQQSRQPMRSESPIMVMWTHDCTDYHPNLSTDTGKFIPWSVSNVGGTGML